MIHVQLCACGTEVRGRCTLIDRRQVELRETECRDLFASYRLRMICVSRQNEIKRCRHLESLKLALLLVGSWKKGCRVQLWTESLN